MAPIRHPNRRSFLSRVIGGTLAAGGLLALVAGEARAQVAGERRMLVDADPGDPARTGLFDSDSGANADPPGDGRGGISTRRRSVTDSDRGPTADPAGRGRGPAHAARSAAGGRDRFREGPPPPAPPPPPPTAGARRRSPPSIMPTPTERFVICPGNRRCRG